MRETKEENGDYINGQGAKVKEKIYKKRKKQKIWEEKHKIKRRCVREKVTTSSTLPLLQKQLYTVAEL